MSEESIILQDKCSINHQPPGITLYIGGKYTDDILKVLPVSSSKHAPMYMMEFNSVDKTITVGIATIGTPQL